MYKWGAHQAKRTQGSKPHYLCLFCSLAWMHALDVSNLADWGTREVWDYLVGIITHLHAWGDKDVLGVTLGRGIRGSKVICLM